METFEKGAKTSSGAVNILDLQGTWREMGRQYGALMSGELKDVYERGVCSWLINEVGHDPEKIKERANQFYSNYPFRFKEIFRGMAETSGMTLEQLQLINAAAPIYSMESPFPQGTGIAAWGDYASGALVFGRNYDCADRFRDFAGDIVLAGYHPSDGSLASATIGYTGQIYAVNGMNEKGLFVELNSGMPSGGPLWYDTRVPAVAALFSFLFDCSSLDEIEACFQTTMANYAYIIGVSDGQTARCYEWPVFGVKRRESHSRPGLTVFSNHFTEFSWGLPRPDDKLFGMTRTRRQNLLALAKHLKGTLDAETMKKIMDTNIEDLGATTSATMYQIVTVPSSFNLWFKIPGRQDWTEFDMKSLLRPREE